MGWAIAFLWNREDAEDKGATEKAIDGSGVQRFKNPEKRSLPKAPK
jgi:hypothetical protein